MATQEEMNKRILAAAQSGDVDILQDCINKGAEVNCQDYNGHTPLHKAAWEGKTEVLDHLLKAGAPLAVVDNEGDTPLHCAAWNGHIGATYLLLKAGASQSVENNKGENPRDVACDNVIYLLQGGSSLHEAAWRGLTEVVEVLLKSGDSPSVKDDDGNTPLHKAARRGKTVVVDLLLKSGVSPSVVNNEGETPLHFAAWEGTTEVVDLLLKSGASPSIVNNEGNTPLHRAAEWDKTTVVDILLKAGASMYVVNNQGETPLHFADVYGHRDVFYPLLKAGASLFKRIIAAAQSGDVDILQDCINKGAEVNCQDCNGDTPLHIAASGVKTDAVELLLKSGASPSVVNSQGHTPLCIAALRGNTEVVDLLLKSGASLSVMDNRGETLLHTAASEGKTDVVELLLKSGASPSVVNSQGETPLHTAASEDKTDVVELLLKSGALPSVVNNQNETPLHCAVREGSIEIAKLLLKSGASLSVVDNQGETPLHTAASEDKTDVVELLLKSGALPSVVNNQNETPLHCAVREGSIEIAKLLLKSGASLSVVDNQNETPLLCAAREGSIGVVNLLLKSGASLSVVDNQGHSPLCCAARRDNTEVVDLLLKSGASLSVMDNQGETPLHTAALEGKTDVVEFLLKSGASPSVVNNQDETPLLCAARQGNIGVVNLLLKSGASLSVVDNQGHTPLHKAAKRGKTVVVDFLLKSGTSPSVVNNDNETPLHCAARQGSIGVVNLLLKSGASLSVMDNQGETPLHRAASEGTIDVVELLLKSGASPSVVNSQGHTPLSCAARRGSTKVVDLLLKSGASLSVMDNQGETPLHTAASEGKTDVVELLLKSGASPSVVNSQDETPLHCAAREGSTEVVNLLLKSGASMSVVDNQGHTPLHKAARRGKTVVVDILLKSGASPSVVNNDGETPLHWAEVNGRTKVVDLLLKAAASLYVVGNQKYAANRSDMVPPFPMMGTAEEMKELITKGTFMAYDNRVYLAGACNVGKSTLASILLDEEIPQSWKSTDGLIIYFGRNGIHLKDKTMIPLRKGFDGDVLSKVLRGQPDMKQEKHPSKYGKSLPKIEKEMKPSAATKKPSAATKKPSPATKKPSPATKKPSPATKKPSPATKKPSPASKKNMTSEKLPAAESKVILSEKTDTELVKGARNKDTHKGLSKPQLQAQKMSKQSYITIHKDIKEELRKGNYKVNIAPSDLVDFGGQKSFDMTHQLFIQHKGEFILMFNGRFDLCDPLREYPQGDVTTESILKHWVSSILSYCADDGDIVPIILFAATHSDFYTHRKDRIDRRKRLIKDLKEMFQDHEQHKRIIYDDIFFINGRDKNDPEIMRLKTKLVEVAFRQNAWGKEMPIAWVPLDLQFSEMRSHNTTLISKEDLTTLNRNNEDLALTDTQIEHFLRAQHSLGKILYFDQHGLEKFIIVQPQSLVNILRSFITDEHFWPHDESLRDILRTMINTGEIPQTDLLKIWSQKEFDQHMPNNDLKEFIIQVLVHLDILVEPKRYSQDQKSIVQSYIVPCIVKRKLPVTDVYYKSAEDKMICLSYKLLKSSIPAALCFKLIGAAMNVWPLKETPEGVCLYHQAAILCIDQTNELHISVKDNKIIIYLIHKEAKRFIPPNIASTVQECLTLTLKKVLEFYHKSFGKSLSTFEVSKLFEIQIGEWCETGACYISVPEDKTMLEWTCKNKKTHKTKFPLFWMFDNTQDTCDEECTGLDTKDLGLCPTDQHLVRLAGLVPFQKFYELVIELGLSNMSWENILEQYRGYDQTIVNFVALCKWRQQKYKEMETTSFKDLSVALTAINHHRHVLCQVFWEDVKVLGIDNIALQRIPDDDVLKELSVQVGNCAMQLGIELGLSMVEIEESLFKYSKDMFSQTFDVLKKWKYLRKVKPTIRILMRAIQPSDPRGLMFLRDKYA